MKKTHIKWWTSKDIHHFWCEQYKIYTKRDYQNHGFLGHELHMLKEADKDFGTYAVLLGIVNAIKDGCLSINNFSENLIDYIPDGSEIYHKVRFFIDTQGGAKEKGQLLEYQMLQGKWTKYPADIKRMQEILADLLEWTQQNV